MVAVDIIYLGRRICRLCKWPARGLLCGFIHYRHKAVDVSPFSPLLCKARHAPGCPLQARDTCSLGDGQTERNVRVELN